MMSRWCDQSIPTRDIPHFPVALYEVAVLFGSVVAKTILASVHVRAHKQAGHMDASDLIKILQYTLQGGGRPHMDKYQTRRESRDEGHHCGRYRDSERQHPISSARPPPLGSKKGRGPRGAGTFGGRPSVGG